MSLLHARCYSLWRVHHHHKVKISPFHTFNYQNAIYMPARLLCSLEFSSYEYWSALPFLSLEDLLNPGTEPPSPKLQADSLLAELQGKPKNTWVGSLSLLQGIFLTQESNWGLLHSGRFFTNWAMREALIIIEITHNVRICMNNMFSILVKRQK